ncbi:NAD(P)H-dependent oxidoreductase [Gordonia sinesedis]
MTTTVVVGNPKRRSRTYATAVELTQRLTGAPADATIDLADVGPALLDWSDPTVADLVSTVESSSLLIVASPTYKATYTGLLKLFLDRFAAGQLAGSVAIPVMLGADWRHSLAGEVHLKPVLAELGASTPTSALYLLDSELLDGATFPAWLDAARTQLAPHATPIPEVQR